MAAQDAYWKSRGVPKLTAEILALGKNERRAWRAGYVQDLYIPDGLGARQEIIWRRNNTVHVLTGMQAVSTGIPLRKVPLKALLEVNTHQAKLSDSKTAQASRASQAEPPSTGYVPQLTRSQRKAIRQAQQSSNLLATPLPAKKLSKTQTKELPDTSDVATTPLQISEKAQRKLERGQKKAIRRAQEANDIQTTLPLDNKLSEISEFQAALPQTEALPGTSVIEAISLHISEKAQRKLERHKKKAIRRAQEDSATRPAPPQTNELSNPRDSQATPPKATEEAVVVSQAKARRQRKAVRKAERSSISPAVPTSAPGFTRPCIAPKKQWHNADGSVWQPSEPPTAVKHARIGASTLDQDLGDTSSPHPSKRQKTRHSIYPSATERRLSSIPDNLGWSNGAEAFKRMAAIVDHSDSEPSESSDDDEDTAQPVTRGSVAESFADRINEGSPQTVKASPDAQLQASLEEAIEIEESHTSSKRISPSIAQEVGGKATNTAHQSTSPDGQQAQDIDTQMQDVIYLTSDSEPEDKGEKYLELEKPSHSHQIPRKLPPKFIMEVEESTQEVYEAVEEVLEDVCSSTRSLPPSTSASPQPPEQDPRITMSCSGPMELVRESVNEQKDANATLDEDLDLDDDESMAEVGEEEGELDMDGVSTGSTSDEEENVQENFQENVQEEAQDTAVASPSSNSSTGSNIVVTMRNTPEDEVDGQNATMEDEKPVRRPSMKSKSSSSILEELSRSPTPPPFINAQVTSTTRRTSQRTRASQVADPPAGAASPQVIVTRMPESKRKMTGVTSKHFSNPTPSKTAPESTRRSRRGEPKTSSQENSQASSQTTLKSKSKSKQPTPFTDDFDGEEIHVAPRRRLETPPNDGPGGMQNITTSILRPPSTLKEHLSQQKIAYVDLTGPKPAPTPAVEARDLPSSQPIAYVDLTGDASNLQVPVSQNVPPRETDEPLDHLAKLLKSPNFAQKVESSPGESTNPGSRMDANMNHAEDSKEEATIVPPSSTPKTPTRIPRRKTPKKTTGTISPHFITDRVDLYNTTSSSRRVPAGTSTVPIPPLAAPFFGIIQEKLWQEPFWLLIAVTFLNKTTGRAAVPIFWKLKKLFPTPEELAEAEEEVVLEMVKSLGLQRQRSKRLISMAKAWVGSPPVKGRMYRTLNYPEQGDGRAKDVNDFVEEDIPIVKGCLEIGSMTGCGAYAFDSWRIFCRDVFRGVAGDYDGKGGASTTTTTEGQEDGDGEFKPEWKRVLPGDKELRACLRWMWMKESVVWDPLTGSKREASEEELAMAAKGEMKIEDDGERKFTERAVSSSSPLVKGEDGGDVPY